MRLPAFGSEYDARALNEMAREISAEIDSITEKIKIPGTITAVNGDTAPSVRNLTNLGMGIINIPATSIYTITDFVDAEEGQHIVVVSTGASTVTINRNNAKLSGGANQALPTSASLQLVFLSGEWLQVGSTILAS